MHACSKQSKFETVKTVSICAAVKSAMKALQENCPDDLQGYLTLNDFILEQIWHACTHNHESELAKVCNYITHNIMLILIVVSTIMIDIVMHD